MSWYETAACRGEQRLAAIGDEPVRSGAAPDVRNAEQHRGQASTPKLRRRKQHAVAPQSEIQQVLVLAVEGVAISSHGRGVCDQRVDLVDEQALIEGVQTQRAASTSSAPEIRFEARARGRGLAQSRAREQRSNVPLLGALEPMTSNGDGVADQAELANNFAPRTESTTPTRSTCRPAARATTPAREQQGAAEANTTCDSC